MKNILLLFAIVGTLFACNKDDDKEPDYYKLFEQAIAETDQEATTKLFEGVWEHRSSYAGHNIITITKDYFIWEPGFFGAKPDTTTLLWAKIDNTYKLIRTVEEYNLGYKYEFLCIQDLNSTTFDYRGWYPFNVGSTFSSIGYFFNYEFPSYIGEKYTKIK